MSSQPPSEQESYDAKQYETALAHLERLQEQLDGLRSTLPSLVAPLLRQHENRAQMYAEIKKSAHQSTSDLNTFRDDWTSEQTQKLLERAKDSAQKDGDLSKANDVARYGWTERFT